MSSTSSALLVTLGMVFLAMTLVTAAPAPKRGGEGGRPALNGSRPLEVPHNESRPNQALNSTRPTPALNSTRPTPALNSTRPTEVPHNESRPTGTGTGTGSRPTETPHTHVTNTYTGSRPTETPHTEATRTTLVAGGVPRRRGGQNGGRQ